MVIQADPFADLPAVTVLPITSTLLEAPLLRIAVAPTPQNGLTQPSQIMIDKPQTPGRARVGPVIGHLADVTLLAVDRALAVFLGLARADHHPRCMRLSGKI